jgi:hypothetical protein
MAGNDAEPAECPYHLLALLCEVAMRQQKTERFCIEAPEVGGGKGAWQTFCGWQSCQFLDEGDSRIADRLAVGADVDQANLDEVLGIEELAHALLIRNGPLRGLAVPAIAHRLFEIVQLHALPPLTPGYTRTQWRKSLSAYTRRNAIENNRNTPARLAGQCVVRSTRADAAPVPAGC